MEYRAVGNRCAVDIGSLRLPISDEEALSIFEQKGFVIINVDIISLARGQIGVSQYHRGAQPSEAPAVVDCSSFVKWLYGQYGIWLPRRSIQQREHGEEVQPAEVVGGDLIFASGKTDYFLDDRNDGVGHVGIATDQGTVIHAKNKIAGIIESPLREFFENDKFRGIRRFFNPKTIVLETPAKREIETADDLKWIIMQSIP